MTQHAWCGGCPDPGLGAGPGAPPLPVSGAVGRGARRGAGSWALLLQPRPRGPRGHLVPGSEGPCQRGRARGSCTRGRAWPCMQVELALVEVFVVGRAGMGAGARGADVREGQERGRRARGTSAGAWQEGAGVRASSCPAPAWLPQVWRGRCVSAAQPPGAQSRAGPPSLEVCGPCPSPQQGERPAGETSVNWDQSRRLSNRPGRARGAGPRFPHGAETQLNDTEVASWCADEGGFDAVTLDERGVMLFFRGDHVRRGFHGPAQLINHTWPEIQGPVDAALRIHHPQSPSLHDSVYLFQGARVWAYAGGRLRPGYPRLIGEEFKGVPGDLDSAVECHPEECTAESLLFFKGGDVFSYDLGLGVLKRRSWPSLSSCSAAMRWLERYYCFQGPRFLRFLPATGTVPPGYPRDARDYFMQCPGRGHGHQARGNATTRAILDPCSGLPFQAFTADDANRTYAFRGGQYFRLDSKRDGWHSWPLNHTWQELAGQVDSAFSWENKLYLIQGSQVYIYRVGPGFTLVQGYPRGLQDELGITGPDATFTCPHSAQLFVTKGSSLERVDLNLSPRSPRPGGRIPHPQVDSAMCNADGVHLFHGAAVHHYASVGQLTASPTPAPPQNVTTLLFGCPH